MNKITNKHYRQFLDQGIIEIITEEHIQQALDNIKGRHPQQGRSLLITLYMSGARPIEALKLRAKDIKKEDRYINIFFQASKGGLARTLEFKSNHIFMKELWNYRIKFQDDVRLFWNYISKNRKRRILKNGTAVIVDNPTCKLNYYFNKWFKNILDEPIPPYYLRHNRISQLIMTGHISEEELRIWKGSKTAESVRPYTHLSRRKLRKITKYIK